MWFVASIKKSNYSVSKLYRFSSARNIGLGSFTLHIFPYIGELGGEYKGNASYQDKIRAKEILIKNVSQNTIRIEEPEGMGQFLAEVVRADFNGDGIEDILAL